ncbi:helix-turn-helix transcriptional regulator [Methanobacterium alcaliphilum]|uniref:helix-turn-helix transcriptional regulator n=1 Tax=Methanobacterium alcaliphilum TaxID=392018 RepID=UPI00200AA477|nr:transcriptional regulator FilR1 domain-containing protein [Methanobacterium alcaliphilum]MCK9151235.1 DUF1724 domain-containing protein [Methanobacterium alcaliphilum]
MKNKESHLLEKTYDDVKFLLVSNIRMKIMLSLYDSPKKSADLREETFTSSSTVLHAITQLEKRNLVSRRGDLSFLSSKGSLVALKLINLIETFTILNRHDIFWKDHCLDGIPKHLKNRFHRLKNAYLIESILENVEKPFTTYLDMLSNANNIKAALPVCFPRHLDNIKLTLNRGGKVDLILTREIFETLIDHCGYMELKKYLKKGNLKIFLIARLDIAYVISEKFMSIGLFFENGEYDSTKLLMGQDNEILEWGNDLFAYHLQSAQKVNYKSLLKKNN